MKPNPNPTSFSSNQLCNAALGLRRKKRVARSKKFLGKMEQIMPWELLITLVEPKCRTVGRISSQPIDLPRRLCMYFLQLWFSTVAEVVQDAINFRQAVREFVNIDLARQTMLDANSPLKLSRLPDEYRLTEQMFDGISPPPQNDACYCTRGTWWTPSASVPCPRMRRTQVPPRNDSEEEKQEDIRHTCPHRSSCRFRTDARPAHDNGQ